MTDELWVAPDIVPSITYENLPRAIEWLTRVFGFHERISARLTWPGGGMAWMEAGNGLFRIATPDESWPDDTTVGRGGCEMKVYVTDLDAHFARARIQGATIVSEPEDGFWGGRSYRALDHERHRWDISQTGRDLAAHRWSLPPGVSRGA